MNRLLALLLVLATTAALAAPPAQTPTLPEALDLDAMARAKDAPPGSAGQATSDAEHPEQQAGTADDPAAAEEAGDAGATPELDEEASELFEAADAADAEAQDTPAAAEDAAGDAAEAEDPAVAEAATEAAGDETPNAAAGIAEEASDLFEEEAAAEGAAEDEPAGTSEAVAADADEEAPVEEGGAGAEQAPTDADREQGDRCRERAEDLLDAAERGDYTAATREFDASMKATLPAAKFGEAWRSLGQFGKLQARGQPHPGMGQGYYVVTIPLVFEKANLYAQIACDGEGAIAGFYVKPLDAHQP
jgi:hypothetical protein